MTYSITIRILAILLLVLLSKSTAQVAVGGGGAPATGPGGAVDSVAGKTGAVVLSASDITSGTFAIARMLTGSATASRCLEVSPDGTAIQVSADACGSASLPPGLNGQLLGYLGGVPVYVGLEGGPSGYISVTPGTPFRIEFEPTRLLTEAMPWSGAHDFTLGSLELPNSSTLPGSCAVGQIYFDSDAPAGQNMYGCTALNTWTLLGGGAVSGTQKIAFIAALSPETITAGTPEFIGFNQTSASVTDNLRQFPVPHAGTATRMTLRTVQNMSASAGPLVCTLKKNSAATGIVITVAASAPAGVYAATGSVHYNLDDLINVECTSGASTTAQMTAFTLAYTLD